MKRRWLGSLITILCLALAPNLPGFAQEKNAAADIDIISYKIDAELIPAEHALQAKSVVKLKAIKGTQSVILELNGSLAISKVSNAEGKQLQFIQDKVSALNVRVDLGQFVEPNTEIDLTFEYSGQLVTPEGGPLPDKRMAYIGTEGSYLTYAARWFPFHDYFADRATAEINIIVPRDIIVAGFSEEPVMPRSASSLARDKAITSSAGPASSSQARPASTSAQDKVVYSFINKNPRLPGTFAASRYITRTIKSGAMEIEFFVKPGSESVIDSFGAEAAQIFAFYNSKFGPYAFGNRYLIAEVDNETLPTYTMAGTTLVAQRLLDKSKPIDEILAREIAYQWWGLGVGLKSFDDIWLSQGLAEFSSLLFRQSRANEAAYQAITREAMERALSFESQTSIRRAPAELDDQSPAYQSIVFYKGAYVFQMLRNTLGDDKFFSLLKDYYSKYNDQKASIDDFEALVSNKAGTDMRYFFGLWVDSTGVPEFKVDYSIVRTRAGAFKVRGTVRQELDAFKMPLDLALRSEDGVERITINFAGTSADFEIASKGKPIEVVIDPDNKILRISDELRIAVIVRRGIQRLKNEEYPEAEQEFQAAIKLNRGSSWAWYNLGLLYLEQRNYQRATDAFSSALDGDLIPPWVEVWSYIKRGNSYDALGQRERAVAEYNKAISNGNDYDNAQAAAQQYLSKPYRRGGSPVEGSE